MCDSTDMEALTHHNQQYSRKDKHDSNGKSERKQFTKDQHTDGYGRQWLQSTHDSRRCGSYLMNGYGHEY